MRKIVFALAAAALAMPALAASDPSSSPQPEKPKKEKKICKHMSTTESRMGDVVCKTAAEWDQEQNSDASKLTGQARQH